MWSEANGLPFVRRESVKIALLVLFALAVFLPSHRSHWLRGAEGDENGQIAVSRQSLHNVVTTYQSGQNHPLYGILAHLTIRALPISDVYAARLPALLAGLLIPVVFYYTHRRWVGRAAALLVAFILVAADPLHYYAAAARGYTLMVLGVLLANALLLGYLRDGRPALLAAYTVAATAAAYSHLWGALVLPAHLIFLLADGISTRGRRKTCRRIGLAGAVCTAAAATLLLYLPMLPEIRSMAGHRREPPLGLVDKVLGLARFRSWTTAAYVLLVPIAVEGLARRLKRTWPDRAVWLHVTIILCVLIFTTVTQPANFYRRFLMVIVPSGAALAAWAFAGAFADRQSLPPRPPPPIPVSLLPLPATWLAGFAVGVLVSNASMSSFMSWQYGAHTDGARDHGYYYRNLPKAVEALGDSISPGFPVAVALLAMAVFAIIWRIRCTAPSPLPNRRAAYRAVYVWTGLLLASIAPLVLGPSSTPSRPWLFEFHTIAAATLCLLAWHYRDDRRLLRALRYGLLLTALVLVYWQLGVERPRLNASALMRIAALVPPTLVAAGMLLPTDGEVPR